MPALSAPAALPRYAVIAAMLRDVAALLLMAANRPRRQEPSAC
ncbi:hypothetical protein [Streptomyces ureilyticus]|nr:hypothetical protein [Streptomyces ureilyticus]